MGVKGTDAMRSRRSVNIFLSAEKLLQKILAASLLSFSLAIVTLFTHSGRFLAMSVTNVKFRSRLRRCVLRVFHVREVKERQGAAFAV